MKRNEHISIRHLIEFRKLLHQTPELSGHENRTAQRITDFVGFYSPTKLIAGIGGTGVAAIYTYADTGPTVLIRCELDALPIQEINDFEHKSENIGVSHKCGHDGHMAIVAGLAAHLSNYHPQKGSVVLLFQPAEENGEGAKAVLEDPLFKEIQPDYVFALHNLPGYPLHTVVCRSNSFTASVKSMIISLHGKTSHAGEPELGINPALAIASILQETNKIQVSQEQPEFKQVTPIQVEMGEEAFGVSAGFGKVKLTIRTWDNSTMKELTNECERIAHNISAAHNLQVEIEWTQFFAANMNHPDMVSAVERAAIQNGFGYEAKETPFRWGEDFGLFTDKFPGAMFGIGAGKETPALHNPDYDFPDQIIATGIAMFSTIIDELLND